MNINKLRGKIAEHGWTIADLATRIGVDKATLYRKIKEKSFSVKEATLIGRELELTADEMMSIFFAEHVA